jgi:hypothetical protein
MVRNEATMKKLFLAGVAALLLARADEVIE